MYPRNNASPPRIAIGAVVQISDGAVQSSGVSVVVRPEGGAESAGGGTIAYSAASGVVYYTPTQAETNYTAFCVIAYKTACIPAQVTVVTTASSTAGTAELDSSARVKLDASQPDYAPATAAALAAIASTGTVNILSRVSGSTITTFMGDDHKVRSGTQIPISVSDPSGTLHAKWAVIGISNLAFGASRAGHPAGEIVGTIAAISYSANVTTVSIEISACGANLKPAEYTYQIQSTQTHTGEYDDTIEVAGLLRLERRTVAAVG